MAGPELTEITVNREAGELQLAFDDGTAGSIPLLELRIACPCAGCRGDRQAGRAPWTPSDARPTPSVLDAQLVGAWGLSLQWDDGHSAGIYPFDALASWVRTGHPGFSPDSGLAG